MAKFDRYMLGQLMLLFGFFALVLVAVYWINNAIQLFDELIADGHSAWVFLEFSALSLPKIIALILPMAGFVAAIYVTNRLSNDSELVVMQATGYSSLRMARPVIAFGIILVIMGAILSHVLVPLASERLKDRERAVSGSVSARLMRDGVFLHPTEGVTFYIRKISDAGELHDVFLADLRQPDREVTYTSERAYLLRSEDGPRLVMLDGMAQTYDPTTRALSTTNFHELIRDVSGLVLETQAGRRKLSYVTTPEMLSDPVRVAAESKRSTEHVTQEIRWRMAQALLCLVTVLIGQGAMLAAGFSRFGVGPHVVTAVVLLVIVKIIEGTIVDVVSRPGPWLLNYLPFAAGLTMALGLYWRADHPHARIWPWRREGVA